MSYCKKCGSKISEEAKFCQSCGSPVSETGMRKPERRSRGARILLVAVGCMVLLTALGLFAGGGVLFWVNKSITDSEGFIATKVRELRTDSYAIVFQHINFYAIDATGVWGLRQPSLADFVTIKIACSSSKNIFIGVANESDAEAYFGNVHYDEVANFGFSPSLDLSVEYTTHRGNAVPPYPASQRLWIAEKHGAGTQTLVWKPEIGNYWFVIMNEDGSAGVDVMAKLGAKIPMLSAVGLLLFAAGGFTLVLGAIMVYFGVHKYGREERRKE